MSRKEYLLVNSEDRDTLSVSSSDFIIDLGKVYSGVKKIRLLSYTIANTIYTVNSNNYRFFFVEQSGGGSVAVSLTQQNYNGSTLSTHVAAAMTALSANGYVYVGAYDSNTLKMTISTTNNFSMTFNNGASAYKILGFDKNPSATLISTTHTSNNVIRLDQSVALMETNFTNHLKTTNDSVNASFLLKLSASGSTDSVGTNNTYDYEVDDLNLSFNQIKIRLKNLENKTLPLNGSDNIFLFEIITEK